MSGRAIGVLTVLALGSGIAYYLLVLKNDNESSEIVSIEEGVERTKSCASVDLCRFEKMYSPHHQMEYDIPNCSSNIYYPPNQMNYSPQEYSNVTVPVCKSEYPINDQNVPSQSFIITVMCPGCNKILMMHQSPSQRSTAVTNTQNPECNHQNYYQHQPSPPQNLEYSINEHVLDESLHSQMNQLIFKECNECCKKM